MNPQPPTARLMGRGGELAGSTFDLGTDSTIGRDEGGRVAVNAPSFRQRFARIFVEEGSFYLEDLGGEGRTRLDGNPVKARTRLGRLHVIEMGEGIEAVFTQVAAAPRAEGGAQPTPAEPVPPTPPPASPPPASRGPSADPDPGHTVLDMAGFGALPDLSRKKPPEPPPRKEESPPPAKAAEGGPGDQGKGGDSPPVDPGHTVLDMAGFGALPDLGRGKRPRDAGEEEKDPPKPPERASPPQGSDPGQTILDMAGFGGLPNLARGGSPGQGAQDAEATRAVPRAPRFELAVDLPGRGPTTFPLKLGDNVLGRSEDCDITVFDPEMWVSRRHAVVRVAIDSVELEDLKGVNGTFIDGKRIDSVQLTPGSTFSLGPHLTFKLREK